MPLPIWEHKPSVVRLIVWKPLSRNAARCWRSNISATRRIRCWTQNVLPGQSIHQNVWILQVFLAAARRHNAQFQLINGDVDDCMLYNYIIAFIMHGHIANFRDDYRFQRNVAPSPDASSIWHPGSQERMARYPYRIRSKTSISRERSGWWLPRKRYIYSF